MILVLLFVYAPAVVAFITSFFTVPLSHTQPILWNGGANFQDVLTNPEVYNALWNTLLYCLMTIIPTVVLGFLLALLVDSLPGRQATISTLLFLPLTANLVAMSVVFRWIYSPDGGFIDSVLAIVGIRPIDFLNNPDLALGSVAALGVWRSASFAMVLFMAGLTTIPKTVHEAAAMDGMRGFAKTTRVTMPMLKPTFILVSVVSVIQSVQVFDSINVMTQGGPQGRTETILILIYRLGFSYFKLGEASALTLLLLVLLIGLGWIQRRSTIGGN
jgi:multiple sugar transport system permease protein